MDDRSARLRILAVQLAALFDSGYPLARGLADIARWETDKNTRDLLQTMGPALDAGRPMERILEEHGARLPALLRVLFRTSTSGIKGRSLSQIARPQADQLRLHESVWRGLRHAVLVSVVALVLTGFYLGFALAVWGKWFDAWPGPSAIVPAARALLITASVLGLVFLIVMILLAHFLAAGKGPGQGIALKLPFVGKTLRMMALADVTRLLAYFLASDVRLTEALELVALSQDIECFRTALIHMARATQEGRIPGAPAPDLLLFSPEFEQTYRTAEKTGVLQEMMDRLASTYAHEVHQAATYTRLWGSNVLLLMAAGVATLAILGSFLPYVFQTSASPLL